MIRKRLHEILEVAKQGDRASRVFDIFIVSLIFLNVVAIVIETVPAVRESCGQLFWWFEVASVLVFTVEYLLRVWTCVIDQRFASPVHGRLRYMATPLAVVDLIAILPFYLPFTGIDLRFMRAVRLFRIFRLLKLGRYITSLRLIWKVIRDKKGELVMTAAVAALLLLIASSLMYFVEGEQQPDRFTSIPATMWWAVATLTTVGYGDICPVTALGRFLGAVVAVLGIGMFALPTAILGSGFVEELQKRKSAANTCPHCGKPLG